MTEEFVRRTPGPLKESILRDIAAEVAGARIKFPTNYFQFVAAVEEVGEAANAFLDNHREGKPAQDVYDECIQASAMFARLAEEGDSAFRYEWTPEFHENFKATGTRPKIPKPKADQVDALIQAIEAQATCMGLRFVPDPRRVALFRAAMTKAMTPA